MFFTKPAVLFSVLALCKVAVAAQPPACLLSVVGDQPNAGDFKAICVTNVDKIQDTISKECGDDKQDALEHFADTCSSHGHKVDSSSSSSSSSSSYTSTATSAGSKSTSTGFSTTTAKNTESTSGFSSSDSSSSGSSASSASDSSSSRPSASGTVSAGASDRHVPAAAFAAVVFVGFAATM